MAYIGNKPANKAIVASDLDPAVITGQTALAVAPADIDEFLISDAGTLKRIDYSLIKGGGEWTKILHTTISSDTSLVAFNSTYITSTYQDYKVVYSNVHCATDTNHFNLATSIDNGSNFVEIEGSVRGFKDDGNVSSRTQTSGSSFRLHQSENMGNATGESISGSLEIFDPSATDTRKHFLGSSIYNLGDSAVAHSFAIFGAGTQNTSAVNYIKFSFTTGDIASGEFTLYGRKIT